MSTLASKAIALAVALLVLAGCTAAGPDLSNVTVGDVQAQVKMAACQSLGNLKSAIVRLSDVNAQTQVGELKAAKRNVDTLVEALRRANEVLLNEQIGQLVTSYDELSRSVDGLANEQTLGQAADSVQEAVAGVNAALAQASVVLECNQ